MKNPQEKYMDIKTMHIKWNKWKKYLLINDIYEMVVPVRAHLGGNVI